MTALTLQEFDGIYRGFEGRGPDTDEYQRLGAMIVTCPEAAALRDGDPFSASYREAAMALYLAIRGAGHDGGYVPARDELSGIPADADVWTGVTPWSFRQPAFVAEFLFSWAHILHLLELDPATGGRVLEYGPGSGQIALLMARLGFCSFAVDIEPSFLVAIEKQAAAMGLRVATDCAPFGDGFAGERFDRILFYEAFHHAFDFLPLLDRLRDRLLPGGRLILCGEPVVAHAIPAVPFPWGPRLDGLSVFCMRRFGWMELGFQRDFLFDAMRRHGWQVAVHSFAGCGRAEAYVARPDAAAGPPTFHSFGAVPTPAALQAADLVRLSAALTAMEQSTSWRITAPLRAARRWLRRAG